MYKGIVHTMTFNMQITEKQIEDLLWCQKNNYENKRAITIRGEGFKISISKRSRWLFLFIDAIKFLGNAIITEDDITVLNNKIKLIFETLDIESDVLKLTRFDFRLDVKMTDAERKLYFKLIEKIQSKRNWLWRMNFQEYKDSSAYFNSKSKKTSAIRLNIYDKEKERINKSALVENYEENILRIEIQLNNSHLRYHNRINGVPRSIEGYLYIDTMRHYFEKYIQPIFYKGNYYDINHATKIIDNKISKKITRDGIREFLVYISRNNMDAAKVKYSEYKFRKYTRILDDLEINPILIPKNHKKNYLENPLCRYFNGIF